MDFGFSSIKEIINTVLLGASTIAIFIAAVTYKLNRRQHYFSVINNCINKFQELFIKTAPFDEEQRLRYIELVNEQLFYMENYYIPSDVAAEWIDGMIDYLPLFNPDHREVQTNPSSRFGDSYEKINIILYPRILNAFTLTKELQYYDLTNPENYKERERVVIDIFRNIKKNGNFLRRRLAIFTAKSFMKRTYKDHQSWKDRYNKIVTQKAT